MTDINAPLGKSGAKRTRAGAPRPDGDRPERRSGGIVGAAFVLAAIAALNAWTFVSRDRLPSTASIVLADASPSKGQSGENAVASGNSPRPSETDGVEIVYGSPEDSRPADDAGEQLAEGRISEGGPKVIIVRDPTAVEIGQPAQLAHLPVDEALEESEWGMLPVRTPDGRRPMDIYARPWSTAGGKRIAVVIGGLGLSQTGTLYAIKTLPPEITLAFAPQGYSLNRWMREARSKGHELLVQVPMEPFDYPRNDPGPHTLTVSAERDANLANLRWALGRLTNFTGIVNYLGARFAADPDAIGPVLDEISDRGLLYLNDGTAGGPKLAALAQDFDTPYVSGHVVIDSTQDPASIRERLEELESIADANGFAIGSGSAFEVTVDTVAAWANSAKKRGFEIVGVSALAR
ncbi:divergent polysaccharide deacetylase family protein [Oricola thermophila]|uniref:Divergent polysaccharide deacetylase family protein n=1 Tax=Oricola thermophila TaxID=2742145 RepID=A0A6N1VHT3_9HYPH|nr:divergent polysaccharide deacetylase family protein [Oricola thermophila]QKV19993.1 divergent polysaccharide deacetylase family protein [Oricola thermophila]